MRRVAPNLSVFLWRPILGGIYTQRDLREWVTLDDALDAHEALDLRDAIQSKAQTAT